MKKSVDAPLPGLFTSLLLLIWGTVILIIPWKAIRWALALFLASAILARWSLLASGASLLTAIILLVVRFWPHKQDRSPEHSTSTANQKRDRRINWYLVIIAALLALTLTGSIRAITQSTWSLLVIRVQ